MAVDRRPLGAVTDDPVHFRTGRIGADVETGIGAGIADGPGEDAGRDGVLPDGHMVAVNGQLVGDGFDKIICLQANFSAEDDQALVDAPVGQVAGDGSGHPPDGTVIDVRRAIP